MTTASLSTPENVVAIGPDGNVIGIITEAPTGGPGAAPAGRLPDVVILNAGVLHRVGPHRLHVILARLLAQAGFRCLRVDLSGIGDSRGLPGALTFRESSVADARGAMDCLQARNNADRFIFFGLCSGADNGLATASADERVCGLILIDPPTYATASSRLRAFVARLSNFEGGPARMAAWALRAAIRTLRNRMAAIASVGRGTNAAATAPGRVPPPQAEYFERVSLLLDRGVKILYVFSGANGAGYNHPDQIYESFPRLRGRVEVAFFPAANHVFTELEARDALLGLVTRWCRENFG